MEKEHPLIESVRLKKLAIASNADPLILKKLQEIIAHRASEALEEARILHSTFEEEKFLNGKDLTKFKLVIAQQPNLNSV